MSILINKNSRLLIQGITGREGLFHAKTMLSCNTNIVAGVTPGKGGEWVLDGKIPVFDMVKTAVDVSGANVSIIFVPARSALDAILEAADAGIPLIVCITEGIPVQDMMLVTSYIKNKGIRLIGPNTPGIITPGEAKAGIIPDYITMPGNIGVVSRSGTLTYEVLNCLKSVGFGVSTCVGIGGDALPGTSFVDILAMFDADPHTEQVVLIGEIGGTEEERAAAYISSQMTKPVVAFIAGQTAPVGKQMGHAGAIIQSGTGKAGDKIKAFWEAGIKLANTPEDIPSLLTR